MPAFETTFRDLKDRFTELHARKENLFWRAKMGLGADPALAQRELGEAEIQLNRFLQSPETLAELRTLETARGASERDRRLLSGWISLFSANVIEDPKARALSEKIVEREAELEHARGEMKLGYIDPVTKSFVDASSVKLSLTMRTDPDEARRRAAFEGLRSIEGFVLANGFLEIVGLRNQLARMLGFQDYYDWRVTIVERMSKKKLFAVLDDLARRTEARATEELRRFASKQGEDALAPWSFPFKRAGELSRALDPYFAFDKALERWGRAFTALGVRYRGATLTLDLVDRKGKYENGFMHGPEVAFFDDGQWRPARINFTANAIPGQVGSGLRAAETLFHEGGHAAHFANILADAPCFSHEFAPTSVAYAETQSMFMDSMLGDADWRRRYALDARGEPMPMELIERAVEEQQPFRGWEERAMLTIPFAERALYELADEERTPERVLAVLREVEARTQGLPGGGVRPVLSVPHLLAGESSVNYHGYILAEMAVQQTRAFFLERDGHLVDNPRIGPDLAKHYWAPGNAVPFDKTLESLTGKGLSADALVARCNLSVDEAIAHARSLAAREAKLPRASGEVDLDATVHVIHGPRTVASTEGASFAEVCGSFERFIAELAPS